jgi:hypothetical protein
MNLARCLSSSRRANDTLLAGHGLVGMRSHYWIRFEALLLSLC